MTHPSAKPRRLGIKRAGNRVLRYTLYMMALLARLHDPYFRAYFQRYQQTHQRDFKHSVIAVANKLNRVLFALWRDQQPFHRNAGGLGHQASRKQV